MHRETVPHNILLVDYAKPLLLEIVTHTKEAIILYNSLNSLPELFYATQESF